MCETRTFGRAVEGSSVSPLMNAVGGLSGGRRGGDTSGAITASSFVGAGLRVPPKAFVFAPGTCCPLFFMREAYANDGSSTSRRKRSAMRWLTASNLRASRSPASVLVVSMLRSRGVLAVPGCASRFPFCNNSAASSAGSSGSVIESRQNTMRIQPSSCIGELFTTLPSQ